MKELFFKLIESPDGDNYLAVREVLVMQEDYHPYSDELDTVEELIEEGKFSEAQSAIADAMPNLLLSPNAHWILSYIADKSDEKEMAEMESLIASACCEGILATGDGSSSHPYTVTRTSDEYDILFYQEKEFSSQSLVHDNDNERHLDVIECTDGTEMWFDITDAYNRIRG